MKRMLCALLAAVMLFSATACNDVEKTDEPSKEKPEKESSSIKSEAIVPMFYQEGEQMFLMDVDSGKKRKLTENVGYQKALPLISADRKTVYYMDKKKSTDAEMTLYKLSGDVFKAKPTVVAEDVWVYTASVDGRVAAYLTGETLYRVVENGKPALVAEDVYGIGFLKDTTTLQYMLYEDVAMSTTYHCYEDGTIEKTEDFSTIPIQNW